MLLSFNIMDVKSSWLKIFHTVTVVTRTPGRKVELPQQPFPWTLPTALPLLPPGSSSSQDISSHRFLLPDGNASCLDYAAETRLHLPVDRLSVSNILWFHPGYQEHIAPVWYYQRFIFRSHFILLLSSDMNSFLLLYASAKLATFLKTERRFWKAIHPSDLKHLPFVQPVLLVLL